MKKVILKSSDIYITDLSDKDYIGVKAMNYDKSAIVKINSGYAAISRKELTERNNTHILYQGKTIGSLINKLVDNYCGVQAFTFETEKEFKKWLRG